MNYKLIAESLYEEAECLEKEASIHESSQKYHEDLGLWAIKENKIEQLKKLLQNLPVEFKAFSLDEEEFPTLDKNLLELEISTDSKNKKTILEILKKLNAFELEKFHVANLEERTKRVNSALSKKHLFIKNVNPFSKENVVKILEHIGAEQIKTKEKTKGGTEYTFILNEVPMFATSSEENNKAIASYKKIKGE